MSYRRKQNYSSPHDLETSLYFRLCHFCQHLNESPKPISICHSCKAPLTVQAQIPRDKQWSYPTYAGERYGEMDEFIAQMYQGELTPEEREKFPPITGLAVDW